MSKYDPKTPEEIAARLVQIKAMLKAREGNKAFAENCEAIRKEIERLEALAAD